MLDSNKDECDLIELHRRTFSIVIPSRKTSYCNRVIIPVLTFRTSYSVEIISVWAGRRRLARVRPPLHGFSEKTDWRGEKKPPQTPVTAVV